MTAAVSARRAGFTLIEVLLALAIMATLAITGYRALSGMLDAEQQLTRERQRWRDLDLFFSRFEYDLGHLVPRAYRLGSADFPGAFLQDNALAFVRALPGEPPQRIGYRFSDSRVELLYWPQLDAPAVNAPAAYPVADAVASLQLRFANSRGEWLDRWGDVGPQLDETPLPSGVAIVLVLTDGTRIERVFALR
jgi:general secretion pathway protein J